MISDKVILEYIERLNNLTVLYQNGSEQAHRDLCNLLSDIKLAYKNDIPELTEVPSGYNTYLERSVNTIVELLQRYMYEEKGENVVQAKNKVFIVHGHDHLLKSEVARTLEKAGFEAIILHEQANSGRAIIEKIEYYSSDVVYAVVLYTPCDLGRDKNDDIHSEKNRARQNVVFEHGYLMGRLGRKHVSALVKGNIETPGDMGGVVYTKVDDTNAWKIDLAKDMKEAGVLVDLNLLLS